MSKKSSDKGKRYERRVIKLLSEFTNRDYRRIPLSGGWNKTGGTVIHERTFSGDVTCGDPDFCFSIEAKSHYEDFSFTAILKKPDSCLFTSWWQQCLIDSYSNNLYPALIFKPNTQDDFISLCNNGVKRLNVTNNIPRFRFRLFNNKRLDPYLFSWKDLADNSNPEGMFGEVEGGLWDAVDVHQIEKILKN